MAELKSCPFCGEKPHLDRSEIFCDCGAKIEIPLYVIGKKSVGGYPTYEEARQEMINLWNTRTKEIGADDMGRYDHYTDTFIKERGDE